MYAIVRSGGKQHKVAVGDVFTTEKVDSAVGASLTLPALLLVDGEAVTTDVAILAGTTVSAEVVAHSKGPKIKILRYKNKTGYKRRMGFRADLTRVRITDITTK